MYDSNSCGEAEWRKIRRPFKALSAVPSSHARTMSPCATDAPCTLICSCVAVAAIGSPVTVARFTRPIAQISESA